MTNTFIDIGMDSQSKWGQKVCGDTLIAKYIPEQGRVIAILSDGLGSGIKASVLSTLTASMALKYLENNLDIVKAASVIMRTLPLCQIRQISYATFSIIDIASDLTVNIVEYDTPSLLFFSNNEFVPIERKTVDVTNFNRPAVLHLSKITASKNDRIIFHTDGLNQSGLGKRETPYGWGTDGIKEFLRSLVKTFPHMSARAMAKQLVNQANVYDGWQCGDDTTCGVIFFRDPRPLLITTGPPIQQSSDTLLAQQFRDFKGTKVVCGDTTAKILARELNLKITSEIRRYNNDIPPLAHMEGTDLVTEGMITLNKAYEYLSLKQLPVFSHDNAALALANTLLDHDEIGFLIGTKVNDANITLNNTSVETRYTIVRKLAHLLEEHHLKRVSLQII
ncbi:MAG: SpoIIE family protein phosphatase [Fibrobacterota bacterium]|nr:SpoIIE family protein phosphatase [Chitinispirillaceae bacterium]